MRPLEIKGHGASVPCQNSARTVRPKVVDKGRVGGSPKVIGGRKMVSECAGKVFAVPQITA